MLKKIIAVAAVASALGLSAGAAHAETACAYVHVDINGTVQDVAQCV